MKWIKKGCDYLKDIQSLLTKYPLTNNGDYIKISYDSNNQNSDENISWYLFNFF